MKRNRTSRRLAVIAVSVCALIAIGLWLASGPSVQKSHESLTNSFYLDEHVASLTTKLSVLSDDGSTGYGSVTKDIVALTTAFTYTDGSGEIAATASQRMLSWGVKIDVYDASGALLGTIQERILESLFKTWTTYEILDAQGRVIAVSQKLQLGTTSFTLSTPSGSPVATLKRPFINLTGDNWYVDIEEGGVVDKRILVMIAAFKSK